MLKSLELQSCRERIRYARSSHSVLLNVHPSGVVVMHGRSNEAQNTNGNANANSKCICILYLTEINHSF